MEHAVDELCDKISAFDHLLDTLRSAAARGAPLTFDEISDMLSPSSCLCGDVLRHGEMLAVSLAIALQRLVIG